MARRSHLVTSLVLIALGAVLALVFADVETPVIGLRQIGVVLIAIGVIDLIFALAGRKGST